MSQFNQKGLTILKRFEGLRLKAYQDQGGIWTIGYGSTKNVTPDLVITNDQAEQRLACDLADTCTAVDEAMKGGAVLSENQYSAFCLFAFNVKGWQTRPLTTHVKAGDVDGAEAHWLLYDKVTIDGVKTEVGGLLERRKAELQLYLSPV